MSMTKIRLTMAHSQLSIFILHFWVSIGKLTRFKSQLKPSDSLPIQKTSLNRSSFNVVIQCYLVNVSPKKFDLFSVYFSLPQRIDFHSRVT